MLPAWERNVPGPLRRSSRRRCTTPIPTPTGGAAQPGMVVLNGIRLRPALVSSIPLPGSGASGGSEIYRIAPDGSPSRIWASREDLVYALAFDPAGRLLAGTGNRGHIFAITGEDRFVDLLKASATQVTAFAKAPGGRPLRFNQQSRQSISAGRVAGIRRQLRERRVRRQSFFPLGPRRIARSGQGRSFLPAAAMWTIPIATGVRGRRLICRRTQC